MCVSWSCVCSQMQHAEDEFGTTAVCSREISLVNLCVLRCHDDRAVHEPSCTCHLKVNWSELRAFRHIRLKSDLVQSPLGSQPLI